MAERSPIPKRVWDIGDTLRGAIRRFSTARAASAGGPPMQSPGPHPLREPRHVRMVGAVSIQLLLVLLVVYQFQIESRTFFQVMVLATAGFVVHALLPLQYRLPFFSILSLVSLWVALGPLDGSYLLALGLVLIGLCHLPVAMTVRVVLLLVTGALFAAWRKELLPAPWSVTIWPILASMFMFRLALYLHMLKHSERRPTPAQTLSYFFMLPNVCFPLYPVIDYATFVRTYYDRDASRIYETGMKWIVRGLIHLLLYRFVYLHLAGDPAELRTLGDLVQFLLATFLLYLRVSGQFHLICGVLHLYGFRLPETHHLYYLASSFTDFWRRINIYWKDFMMKLVYYPSYFQLRRWGGTTALVGSTLIVFLATWMLHSYQWFWLRGDFPFTPQDALFWSLLGVLVVWGSLREIKRPRQRSHAHRPVWSGSLALRTFGTFTVICVLWSLWSSDSVIAWLMMWVVAENLAPGDLWLLAGLVIAGLLVAGRPWSIWEADDKVERPLYQRPMVHSTVLLLGMLVIGHTDLYVRHNPRLAATVASLQGSTLNTQDRALRHKGYYENLDNVSRMSAQLWSVQAQKPAHWVPLGATEAWRDRDGFLRGDLRPGVSIVFMDQPFTVNRWGIRGRDRPLEKPKGVYRVALLGPSHVMGSGVGDGETFATFLEERLNRQLGRGRDARYEVLNFGVAGYSLLEQLARLEDRAVMFQPDAVFITDSPRLKAPVVSHLLRVVASGKAIPYPGLDAMVRQTGVHALANPGVPVPFESVRSLLGAMGMEVRMPWHEAERRLRLIDDELVRWTLAEIAALTRAHHAVPVFVALDNVDDPPKRAVRALKDAEAAGFVVFDLFDLWRERDKSMLRLGEWDNHPNAAGQRIIADRLAQMMLGHASELRLGAAAMNPSDPHLPH